MASTVDQEQYMLGAVCKKNPEHTYEDTGQTLRRKTRPFQCVQCYPRTQDAAAIAVQGWTAISNEPQLVTLSEIVRSSTFEAEIRIECSEDRIAWMVAMAGNADDQAPAEGWRGLLQFGPLHIFRLPWDVDAVRAVPAPNEDGGWDRGVLEHASLAFHAMSTPELAAMIAADFNTVDTPEGYLLVDGHHRYQAYQRLGIPLEH